MGQLDKYKQVLLEGANSLASRFNPVVGCIRSWDHNGDKWQYPVIIDNMMNLEFLFWATKVSGDSTFYKIAVTHADNTMKNHFRKDYSSYHVIDYDTITGNVRNKHTYQGMPMNLLGHVGRHGVCMVIRCVIGRLETGDI